MCRKLSIRQPRTRHSYVGWSTFIYIVVVVNELFRMLLEWKLPGFILLALRSPVSKWQVVTTTDSGAICWKIDIGIISLNRVLFHWERASRKVVSIWQKPHEVSRFELPQQFLNWRRNTKHWNKYLLVISLSWHLGDVGPRKVEGRLDHGIDSWKKGPNSWGTFHSYW